MSDSGDIGWYSVHANVDGAAVMFDNDAKGKIAKGILSVLVFVTGTPHRRLLSTRQDISRTREPLNISRQNERPLTCMQP
jgi:hypothetical protein